MVRYFILIKRKNSKRYLGAIPARIGISISTLRQAAKKQIKKGFNYKIITETALSKFLPKLLRRPKTGGIKMMPKKRLKKTVKRKSHQRKSAKRKTYSKRRR